MKRTIKVNGRSYTFDSPRNAAFSVETALDTMASCEDVKYKRSAPIVFGIDGKLIVGVDGVKVGKQIDSETMGGKAALADVCIQFSRDVNFGQQAEKQCADILAEHDVDLTKAVVSE